MIHLKIISAKNLPAADKNGFSDPYVKIIPHNFDFPDSYTLAKTKTIKKTLNPEWNEEILIPFPLFHSIRLEFWDANKILQDTLLGWANLYPTPEDIYQSDQPTKTSSITLKNASKQSKSSTFEYSYGQSFTNFALTDSKKVPSKIFAYLSLDSPTVESDAQMFVFGVNKNGTIIDASCDLYTRGEYEACHFSPTGPTQVFYFDKENLIDDQYFFIVKASKYRGNVKVIFLRGPDDSDMKKYMKKFGVYFDDWTISVENEGEEDVSIHTFPMILKFQPRKVQIDPISLPSNLLYQKVDHSNSDSDTFSKIIQISDEIGKLICPKKMSIHRRFEIIEGQRYSLIDAFSKCGIDQQPSEIKVGLGWDTYTDLDASILQVLDNGKQLKPVCFFNPKNKDSTIKTSGDDLTGEGPGDDETLTLKLDKIDQNIKYLAIVITSYRGMPFDQINGAFCRIYDSKTNKEVMYLKISKKENHTGLLFGILGRVDGVWDMWPCMTYFDGKTPDDAKNFFDGFLQNGMADKILSV